MTTITETTLADEIVDRARIADQKLREGSFYSRLLAGRVTRDEYAAWLVQIHKYVRYTERLQLSLADAMAARAERDPAARMLRSSAKRAAQEEAEHDEFLLNDLAVLWNVSPTEALGRVEREVTAPAIRVWERMLDMMVAHYPEGIIGVALALESIAAAHADETHDSLLASSQIEGIEKAVSFIHEHSASVEGDHILGARARMDVLSDPVTRSAAFFYANGALAMFEGTMRYLQDRFERASVEKN